MLNNPRGSSLPAGKKAAGWKKAAGCKKAAEWEKKLLADTPNPLIRSGLAPGQNFLTKKSWGLHKIF